MNISFHFKLRSDSDPIFFPQLGRIREKKNRILIPAYQLIQEFELLFKS